MTEKGFINVEYVCDENWIGKGETMFAKKRSYFERIPFLKLKKETNENGSENQK